jgi:glutathione peroxidase
MKNKMAMKAIKKISDTYKEDKDIIWNFTKFLVDREGKVVARYSPIMKPEDMEEKIKELI